MRPGDHLRVAATRGEQPHQGVEHVPVAPIIVGYPRDVPPPVPRKAPEVRWIG